VYTYDDNEHFTLAGNKPRARTKVNISDNSRPTKGREAVTPPHVSIHPILTASV